MKNTTPIKDKTIKFTVPAIDPAAIARGHTPHRGGAGKHKHKCDRRQGNRSQRIARAVGEY
jgi:hypothetical protein